MPPCVRNADSQLLEARYGFRQLTNGTGQPTQPWVTAGFAGWSVFYSGRTARVGLADRTLAEASGGGAARSVVRAAGGQVVYTLTPLADGSPDPAHARLVQEDARDGTVATLLWDRPLYPAGFAPPWVLLREDRGDGSPKHLWALHTGTGALQQVSDRTAEATGGPVAIGFAVVGHHAVWAEAQEQPGGRYDYTVRSRDLDTKANGPSFHVSGGADVAWLGATAARAVLLLEHDEGADVLLWDPATGEARPLPAEPGWTPLLVAAGGGTVVVAERRGGDEARLRAAPADGAPAATGAGEVLGDLRELGAVELATDGHDLVLVAAANPGRGLQYAGTQVYWKPLGNRS